MSRHQKIRGLDYDQEYDDYYGAFDDDDDFDDEDFESKYLSSAKAPPPKLNTLAKDEQKTARFQYSGKKSSEQKLTASSTDKKPSAKQKFKPNVGQAPGSSKSSPQATDSNQKWSTKAFSTKQNKPTSKNEKTSARSEITLEQHQGQQKPLATLSEKRKNLRQKLKENSEPTAQDWEAFKVRALETTREFNEIFKNSRARINLVVVGHVDAGKSTLVGHLLYKLGQVSNKQMHRYEVDSQRSGKASFKFAWALDETDEERSRGVTIDIALTKFETPHKDVILLDAPGHVDFIPAVITGAAQADAALLVVDATRGEFETGFQAGGQTREHTFLVRSLGVKSLIVVVNKMDNVEWDWYRFLDIAEQVKPFLKQVGFNLKEDVQFVAVSGLTGENLTERRQDVIRKHSSHPQMDSSSIYSDPNSLIDLSESVQPSLLGAIDRIKPVERMVDKPTRVCVTDVFKGMSSGVFLGAKVVSGKIEAKQKLLLLPPNELCDIKQVEVRDSKSTHGAYAGDIITTVAVGQDIQKFYRGCILCDPVIPCNVTNRFQARIIMLQGVGTILIKGTPIEVHINGSFECGEVRKLISLLNKNSGELIQNKPRCVAHNSSAIIQLKLERVICCELYESNKDLGRFMMRSYGKTIAAGLITKIKRPKVPKSGSSKLKSK